MIKILLFFAWEYEERSVILIYQETMLYSESWLSINIYGNTVYETLKINFTKKERKEEKRKKQINKETNQKNKGRRKQKSNFKKLFI